MRIRLPPWWPRLLLYGPPALVVVAFVIWSWRALAMPGHCHRGPLPPLTEGQRGLVDELRASVTHLATDIGERRVGRPVRLTDAATFIEAELVRAGYSPRRHEFFVRGGPT